MQFATDTELASYLQRDHRNLVISLWIDWDNDNYASPYADMSSIWEEIIIQRDYQGNIPDDVKLLEGYSVAKMTVTLSGRRLQDSLPIRDLISRWNEDSPFYDESKLECAIKCYVTAPLDTPRVMNQFVGLIRGVSLTLHNEVKIEALDLMSLLFSSVVLKPTAVDYFTALTTANTLELQSWNSVWVIDQILRQCGLYNSPAPVESSATITPYFCATLNGSWNPEANGKAVVHSALNTVTSPTDKFIAGKYGFAANGTSTKRGRYRYMITPTVIDFPVTWAKGETMQCGGWIYGPQACVNSTHILCDVTLSGDPDLAGLCAFELYLSAAGVVSARLRQLTGQSYSVTVTGPTILGPAAWHYIGLGLTWRTSNSGVTFTFNVDGAITTSVNATVLLAFTSYQYYATVRLESNMPTQHVQFWKTNSGTLTWPKDPPTTAGGVTPQTDLSIGLLNQTKIPDTYHESGLSVMARVIEAELGVIYSTEDGLIRFLNRSQVLTERIPANNFILETKDLAGLVIHDRDDSFRNKVVIVSTLDILLGATVYKSDRAELFDTPATTDKPFVVNVSGIQRLHPLVIPFTNPWGDPAGITSGFHVTKVSDGTIPSGVVVAAALQDARNLNVTVYNSSAFLVRLGKADGTATLHVGGYWVVEFSEQTETFTNSTAITALGRDQAEHLGKSEWRSHHATLAVVAQSILDDTSYPLPFIEPVEVRGDPRRQLNDTATLHPRGIGTLETAVIGYTRTFRRKEPIVDRLVLQALSTA